VTFSRDHELKIVSDRIALAEKHFATLSKDILSYNTSLEGEREKGSKLSATLDAYAGQEYPSVRNAMQNVSECIATVQDYLNAEVSKILLIILFIINSGFVLFLKNLICKALYIMGLKSAPSNHCTLPTPPP
jgi:hypothetical protein